MLAVANTMLLEQRAVRHAALGDAVRLTIVDELMLSDRSPVELRRLVGIESNLLAHHLDVLESVGMIARTQSGGDGRRRYVHLVHSSLADLAPRCRLQTARALFVCTRNSARSQLAAASREARQRIDRQPARLPEHVRARKRRMPAQVHFGRRREPPQAKRVGLGMEKRGL